MFLNRLRAFLRLFGSTGILFLLLASLLWGLKEGWSWVSLEMQFLGYKGSVAALGPDPRLPIVGTTFPPLLVLATAILGRSPLLLQTVFGSCCWAGCGGSYAVCRWKWDGAGCGVC